LRAGGCELIRAGTITEGLEELRALLDFLRPGDVLMATRIDRLARSIADLQDIVRIVEARGDVFKGPERRQPEGSRRQGRARPRASRICTNRSSWANQTQRLVVLTRHD
jgi:DNA invertase Pin-like site-specific DNA recombinase